MTILFDLDGTLLPMDTDGFVDKYFAALVRFFAKDLAPEIMGKALKLAVKDMMTQTGETNIDVFFRTFHQVAGAKPGTFAPVFDRFYAEVFDGLQGDIPQNQNMQEAFTLLKNQGHQMVLATNPAFPVIAQVKRLKWAGINPQDVDLVTGCDNSTACKPHLAYYQEILQKTGAAPEDCLMIGNDVDDDMVAGKLGISTYLVTDMHINKSGTTYNGPAGDSAALLQYVRELSACI